MEKIVTAYQELKLEFERKQKELIETQEELLDFEKITLMKLNSDGWMKKDDLDYLYKDKRDIKLWVEEVKEVGNQLKFKLVCVGGDEKFKGCVVRYSVLKANKDILTSKYKATEVFNVHLLSLKKKPKSDTYKSEPLERHKIGGVVLYKTPEEFYSKRLYLKKPGRK